MSNEAIDIIQYLDCFLTKYDHSIGIVISMHLPAYCRSLSIQGAVKKIFARFLRRNYTNIS